MSDAIREALNDAETYAQYHAVIKNALAQAALEELRGLTMVPEPLLLPTILARIDQLEGDLA